MDLYNLAYNEQFDDVGKRITEDPDMAIMGFAAKQHKLLRGAVTKLEK